MQAAARGSHSDGHCQCQCATDSEARASPQHCVRVGCRKERLAALTTTIDHEQAPASTTHSESWHRDTVHSIVYASEDEEGRPRWLRRCSCKRRPDPLTGFSYSNDMLALVAGDTAGRGA